MDNRTAEEIIKYFKDNKLHKTALLLGGSVSPEAFAYNTLGGEAFKNDDFHLAIEYYTKAIEYDLKNSTALRQRAICYRMIQEYDKSIEDAFKSKQIDDNFVDNQTLALCYLFKKEYTVSKEYFDITIN